MMSENRVSVYVPAYNAEPYLEACLTAIRTQDYPLEDIVVINDGSTDNTAEIARRMEVNLVNQSRNMGLGAARNLAFQTISSPFIASLDADCVPDPDWLTNLMEQFDSDRVAGVGGKLLEKYQDCAPDRWRARHMKQHRGDTVIINPLFLYGNNNVFRREAVLAAGNYPTTDEYRTNYEDHYMSQKLYESDWTLKYTPDARVYHLRRDTWRSIYHTSWRWYFNGKPKPVSVRNLGWRIKDNVFWTLQYLKKDIKRADWFIIPVTLGYAPALSIFDLKYFLNSRR